MGTPRQGPQAGGIKHVSGIKAGRNEGHTVTALVGLLMGDLIGEVSNSFKLTVLQRWRIQGGPRPFWGTPELYKGVLAGKCLPVNAPSTTAIIEVVWINRF